MPNFILIPQSDFLACTVTASSENASFPGDNVLVYGRPGKEYRSGDTAETTLVLDFGAVAQVGGLYVGEVNFEDLVIQGNDTDSWSSPAFSQAVTVTLDVLTQRRKGFFLLTSFEYQYLRLVIENQTRTDGAAFYRIGVVLAVGSAAALAYNPSWGYEYGAQKMYKRIETESGSVETVITGLKSRWRGVLDFDTRSGFEPTVEAWNAEDPGSVFLFYENGWNSGDSARAWLAKLEGEIRIGQPQYGKMQLGQMTLVEVV